MKKFSKVFAVILAVIFVLQSTVTAFAAITTGSLFTSSTYTHNDKFDSHSISHGIDVSYHNSPNGTGTDVDWAKIKKAGVEYAILRVGYRGYAAAGKLLGDSAFSTFIHNAYKQGIKLGIYFYSQAVTTEEAVDEANFSIQKLQEATADIPGFKLDLPIVYDYEFASVATGRLDSAWSNGTLTKTKMTNNAIAFCNAVKNAGYEAMIYANKSFLNTQLNKTTIANAGYKVWLAHYTTKTDYAGDYEIWQYSSTGKVNGITGNVDCNFMYTNNTTFNVDAIPNQVYNGTAITPDINVTYQGVQLVRDTHYTLEYSNNVNVGTANIVIYGIGEYSSLPMQVVSFKIVPPAVTGVSLVQRGTKTVEISWTPVADATGYKVQVKKSTGWVDAGSTTNTTHTVTGLAVASNYQVRVLAYKTISSLDYDGMWSDELQTATMPDKVAGVKTTARTTTSLTLSWTKQTNASNYEVYKYDSDSGKYTLYKTVEGGSGSSASVKVTGLSSNTKYKFKVRAVKNAKEGVTLNGSYSSVYSDYTKAKAPSLKSASSSKKKKLTAKWAKVSGVTGYQVKWSQKSNFSGSKTVTVKGASSLSKTVTTAKSKQKYYVKVRAYKTVNGTKIYSSWSKTKTIKVK